MDDWQLLEEYAERESDPAFRALVERHLALVYSSALRQARDPGLAEEITQAVFILLARKARSFRRDVILPGWLLRTTRFVASRAIRSEHRRQRREQEAAQMQQFSSPDQAWERIAPVLDEALDHLGGTDRHAIVLRFFQDKSLRAAGTALGLSEDAAKKRVSRALEKMRAFFARRGFTVTATILGAALAAHSVKAAPEGLRTIVSSAVLAHATEATAVLPDLVRETLNAWRWTRLKIAAGFGVAGIALVALVFQWPWRSSSPTASLDPRLVAAGSPAVKSNAVSRITIRRAGQAPTVPAIEGSLAFRVLDAQTGSGIVGARVRALRWHDWQVDPIDGLATDAEGRCDVPLTTSVLLRLDVGVLADGHAQKFMTWRTDHFGPIPSEYTLSLERGVSLGGWVRDESGRPIAEAEIAFQFAGVGDSSLRERQRERLGFPGDWSATKTDSAGRWSCAVVPADYRHFLLKVTHPDFVETTFANDKDERNGVSGPKVPRVPLSDLEAGKAELMLQRGQTVSGVILDDQQRGVTGANIYIRERGNEATAASGSDGFFSVTRLKPGVHQGLIVAAEGFAPERIEFETTNGLPPLRIQLRRGALLKLRVVDETQAGVPRARVGLEDVGFKWGGFTDDDGRIEWRSAPAHRMSFYVGKPGYFNSRNNAALADGNEHLITLRAAISVSGRVVDAETREPIPQFKAIPGFWGNWDRSDTQPGVAGQYTVTFTEAQPPFRVRIEAEGYEPAESEPFRMELGGAARDFELRRVDRK